MPIIWRILVLSLMARFVLASIMPLGVDEAYATAVAREFSWSFFEHPPFGFWAPVAMANLTGIEHPVIYRLPSLIFGSLTTALIFAIGKQIGGERAGNWAAVLHAVSPAFFFIGFFVLPDGPLGLGSAFAVFWLVRIAQQDRPPTIWWVYAGLGLAFALASKYQAGLVPIAALVFALIDPRGRRWFATPGPYIASLVGLIGLLPVLIWNLENDWISFSFHTGRTGDGVNLINLALMVTGQFVYLLPVIALFAVIGFWKASNSGRAEYRLLAIVALIPILAFNAVYLFSDTSFPHWTLPGWLFALPLAGVWLAGLDLAAQWRARNWLVWVGSAMVILSVVLILHVRFGIITRFVFDEAPAWDNTFHVFDYSGLQGELDKRDLLHGIDVIGARGWIEGGLISTGLGGATPMRVLGGNAHHFQFMDAATAMGGVLLLHPHRLGGNNPQAALLKLARGYDLNAELLDPIVLDRGGLEYVNIIVIRLEIAP